MFLVCTSIELFSATLLVYGYRLTYWWSNVVVLREAVSHLCEDVELGPSGVEAEADTSVGAGGNDFAARALRSQQLRKSKSDITQLLSPPGASKDWRSCSMFVHALMKVEAWLHARVLESVWWQVSMIFCTSILKTETCTLVLQ